VKTTVYLEDAEYRRLKVLAASEGRSAAELIRLAVADFTRRRGIPKGPRSLGAGRSGRGDLSERAEDHLQGMGHDE
jgi:hypothetical protein